MAQREMTDEEAQYAISAIREILLNEIMTEPKALLRAIRYWTN